MNVTFPTNPALTNFESQFIQKSSSEETIETLTGSMQGLTIKTPFVIFLDIDGVLYNTPDQDGVFKKVAELFPTASRFDGKEYDTASAYFFNKAALENLDFMIKEIEKTRRVWIVISSNWRENRSVESLKKEFFGIHNFAKHIIDKTVSDNLFEENRELQDKREELEEKFLIELNSCCNLSGQGRGHYTCRASEIKYWLKQHPEISNYIVLDDAQNEHLSENFGERFAQTESTTLLTREIAENILKISGQL